jgi:4-hydroxybenzoate polyprenyltransferase
VGDGFEVGVGVACGVLVAIGVFVLGSTVAVCVAMMFCAVGSTVACEVGVAIKDIEVFELFGNHKNGIENRKQSMMMLAMARIPITTHWDFVIQITPAK